VFLLFREDADKSDKIEEWEWDCYHVLTSTKRTPAYIIYYSTRVVHEILYLLPLLRLPPMNVEHEESASSLF
jgi:hypothetical protein